MLAFHFHIHLLSDWAECESGFNSWKECKKKQRNRMVERYGWRKVCLSEPEEPPATVEAYTYIYDVHIRRQNLNY